MLSMPIEPEEQGVQLGGSIALFSPQTLSSISSQNTEDFDTKLKSFNQKSLSASIPRRYSGPLLIGGGPNFKTMGKIRQQKSMVNLNLPFKS